MIQKEMQWEQERYSDYFKVYTDGSKRPPEGNEHVQTTGFGVHAPAQPPILEEKSTMQLELVII